MFHSAVFILNFNWPSPTLIWHSFHTTPPGFQSQRLGSPLPATIRTKAQYHDPGHQRQQTPGKTLSRSCHLLESNRRTEVPIRYVRYDDMHLSYSTDTRWGTVLTVPVWFHHFKVPVLFLSLHSLLIRECQWLQSQSSKSLNVLIYICLMWRHVKDKKDIL